MRDEYLHCSNCKLSLCQACCRCKLLEAVEENRDFWKDLDKRSRVEYEDSDEERMDEFEENIKCKKCSIRKRKKVNKMKKSKKNKNVLLNKKIQ